jgi:hypothetical protein
MAVQLPEKELQSMADANAHLYKVAEELTHLSSRKMDSDAARGILAKVSQIIDSIKTISTVISSAQTPMAVTLGALQNLANATAELYGAAQELTSLASGTSDREIAVAILSDVSQILASVNTISTAIRAAEAV